MQEHSMCAPSRSTTPRRSAPSPARALPLHPRSSPPTRPCESVRSLPHRSPIVGERVCARAQHGMCTRVRTLPCTSTTRRRPVLHSATKRSPRRTRSRALHLRATPWRGCTHHTLPHPRPHTYSCRFTHASLHHPPREHMHGYVSHGRGLSHTNICAQLRAPGATCTKASVQCAHACAHSHTRTWTPPSSKQLSTLLCVCMHTCVTNTHTHMRMTTHVRTYVYNKVLTLCVWVRVGACMRECVHCFRKHTHGYTATGASVQRTCALSEHAAGRDVIVVRHAHARTYTHTHTHAYTYAHVASSTLVPHAKRVPCQQHTHTHAPPRGHLRRKRTRMRAHTDAHIHTHIQRAHAHSHVHTHACAHLWYMRAVIVQIV